MEENKKTEVKLLVFLEDNNETKSKRVIIISENFNGITFNFIDENDNAVGAETFLPWHAVKKIKNIGDKDGNS